MSDPYKILGVSPNDSDENIKSAYRELAKKYHPDNYQNNPLAELASEKMKEINEAYDTIMNERKLKKSHNYRDSDYSYSQNTGSRYNDVRQLILSGRIVDAELILNGIPAENRDAEWFFLKATIFYKRGWLEEAYVNFEKATNMDPTNKEYRAAFNQIKAQRSGAYGGYNPSAPVNTGCGCCDICSTLICADCCCECMGGDCIPCC